MNGKDAGTSDGAEGQVVLRVHRVRGEVVVAACDAELVETDVRLGQRTVTWAQDAGLLAPDGIGELAGIPHAEIFQVP